MFQGFFCINTVSELHSEHLVHRLPHSMERGMVIILNFLKHVEADQYCVLCTASYWKDETQAFVCLSLSILQHLHCSKKAPAITSISSSLHEPLVLKTCRLVSVPTGADQDHLPQSNGKQNILLFFNPLPPNSYRVKSLDRRDHSDLMTDLPLHSDPVLFQKLSFFGIYWVGTQKK